MRYSTLSIIIAALFLISCEKDNLNTLEHENELSYDLSSFSKAKNSRTFPENASSVSYPELVRFTRSSSSEDGLVYEVLPGEAALDPSKSPTPFSNIIKTAEGSYSYEVSNVNSEDSPSSQDAVTSVNIQFTRDDGTSFLIDKIRVIHKPEGAGDHTFFGGVGQNEVMHGNTGIGNPFMPKLLSYITLWGITDLKDAETREVIAPNRLIHIMTTTNVRDEDLNLITSVEEDQSDYNIKNVQTHIILPGSEEDPVLGTGHGFLHVMFEKVKLEEGQRDYRLAYEVLPGPSAIFPEMSPTPFSDKIAIGAGSYNLHVRDITEDDSEDSKDAVLQFRLDYQRQNGESFIIDDIHVIHKAEGSGDHTFFGGVGQNVEIHGDTEIGNNFMPKLTSYISLWGTADLKDGHGNILAEDRMIHLMVSAKVRDENLNLLTSLEENLSDLSRDKVETHIILPDLGEYVDKVPEIRYGFLHFMFESVDLKRWQDLSQP